jgi:hypothetical protein
MENVDNANKNIRHRAVDVGKNLVRHSSCWGGVGSLEFKKDVTSVTRLP